MYPILAETTHNGNTWLTDESFPFRVDSWNRLKTNPRIIAVWTVVTLPLKEKIALLLKKTQPINWRWWHQELQFNGHERLFG